MPGANIEGSSLIAREIFELLYDVCTLVTSDLVLKDQQKYLLKIGVTNVHLKRNNNLLSKVRISNEGIPRSYFR